MKIKYYLERFAALLTALILLQTLFYKFTGAPESIFIFSQLHLEPWGRILTGIMELIAGSLLIFRKTSIWGAILGLGIISGAILSHLFILGIQVQNDGGKLFLLALLVLAGSATILILRRNELLVTIRRILSRNSV